MPLTIIRPEILENFLENHSRTDSENPSFVLTGEAGPLSMIQDEGFLIGVRLNIIVREAVEEKVWKRKVTNQGWQKATGEELWGRLLPLCLLVVSEVGAGQPVMKTSWL